MSGAHAPLPPSGADAWVHCPMWPTMNRLYPQDDTEATLKGSAGHWIVSEFLTTRLGAVHGQVAPNGYVITDDMIRSAMVMVDLIRNDPDLPPWLNIEKSVSMAKSIHANNWGTPDLFAWIHRRLLRVYDYKAGHKFVAAVGNWQCVDYVRGILDAANLTEAEEDEIDVEIWIVQPDNYDVEGHVRKWYTSVKELRSYWTRLSTAAYAASQDDPHATTGAHCIYCPGRGPCVALKHCSSRVVALTEEGTAFNMLPEHVGNELAVLQAAEVVLKARISGLEAEVEAHLGRGVRGIGYVLERKHGNLAWELDAKAVYLMGELFGVEARKDAPITPTQAIAAGIPEAIVRSYSDRPLTAPKLVKFENSLAHRAFTKDLPNVD